MTSNHHGFLRTVLLCGLIVVTAVLLIRYVGFGSKRPAAPKPDRPGPNRAAAGNGTVLPPDQEAGLASPAAGRALPVAAQTIKGSSSPHRSLTMVDREEADRILAEAGLEWPKTSGEVSGPVVDQNIRMREREALATLASDPRGTVERLKRQIRYEEEKFIARKWLSQWTEARPEGRGNEAFPDMLPHVSDRHLEIFVRDVLPRLPEREALAGAVMAQTADRPQSVRIRILAMLADGGYAPAAVRERLDSFLRESLGGHPGANNSWTLELDARRHAADRETTAEAAGARRQR